MGYPGLRMSKNCSMIGSVSRNYSRTAYFERVTIELALRPSTLTPQQSPATAI